MNNAEILKKAKEILGRDLICRAPFSDIDFSSNGDIASCCAALINYYTFGNIFESDSIEKIWNSKKAQEFRKSILDGSFKYCNLNSCLDLTHIKEDKRFSLCLTEKEKSVIAELPKKVFLNIDKTCNVCCKTCRDTNIYDKKEIQRYYELVDSSLIPLLKNAELVFLNGAGEIFASNLCKSIVKKITNYYPHIKFHIITNGILATEQNIIELGLRNKIDLIAVSLHAASEKTYNKIVKGGNYNKVMKNLKILSKMKKQGEMQDLVLNFVVTSYNYKEMIDFQKIANELGAKTMFWEYRQWGQASLDKRYEEVAVFEPYHPEYAQFLEIIKNEIFNSSNCSMNNKLKAAK